MLGAISAGIKALAGLFDVIGMYQRWRQRQDDKKSGRQEQKLEDLKARESQASEANAIDEDVAAMSDDDIQRELRDGS